MSESATRQTVLLCQKTETSAVVETSALVLPFIRGVELHCYHIQGIPRGDADATK